jgi:hypothetical protein
MSSKYKDLKSLTTKSQKRELRQKCVIKDEVEPKWVVNTRTFAFVVSQMTWKKFGRENVW